jgi:dihydroorotase
VPESDTRDMVILGATYLEPGGVARQVDVGTRRGLVSFVAPRVWGDQSLVTAAVRRPGTWVVDGTQDFLAPGFIDLHAHTRDFDEFSKETVGSAAEAAAAGGFTALVAMANTRPPIDDVERLQELRHRAERAVVRVLPVAAVTRGLEGRELTDFEALADAGAVAFSDDGRNAYDLELATAAVKRATALGRAILVHAQDEATCPDGEADPAVARRARLKPWPCEAETAAVRLAIEAARRGDGRVHIQHISCAGAVGLVADAKDAGLAVTAEVTPHHLALGSERVLRGGQPDPMAKVNPPLRGQADREALVQGLAEGVIDAIATDHAPHDAPSKEVSFADASFGISGLETALGLCLNLVEAGTLSMRRLVEALTVGPWRCLGPAAGLPQPGLRQGEPADLVLFDNKGAWDVDPRRFRSRGQNTPLAGVELRGRVYLTVAAGRPIMSGWWAGAA